MVTIMQACDSVRLARIEKLYREAFPAQERKPFQLILDKRAEGDVEIQSIEGESGQFYGLAITILYQDMVLLDYFAIQPEQRGNGIGSQAFALLRGKYAGKRFFLEIERTGVEAENALFRQKRKAFYLRNGMQESFLFVRLFGVEMEVLVDGCSICFEEYKRLYTDTFGQTRMGKQIHRL